MTVVIACKFWKAVAVIADCRVSYLPPYQEVDDCLQKIYQIGDRLVLGFSGPLQGAYEVMALVEKNAQEYSRTPIADNLQSDVERWIRYKYRTLDERDRRDLSFVLATIEPKREKHSSWFNVDGREGSKPKWFPFIPEWKTMTLKPSRKDPGELAKDEWQFAKIIGIKGDDRKAVERVLTSHYGFAANQPVQQAQAIMGLLKFALMRRQVKTVGGLFQCALLSENGIRWLGYGGENVILEFVQDRFVQHNTVTGETAPLMSIREWAKTRPKPGSFGPFEDPGLQRALEDSRNLDNAEVD